MKNCKYCGAMLPDDARACSNCGRPTGYVPVKAPEEKKTAPEAVDSGSDASKAGEDSSWNTGSFENAEHKEKSGTWSRPVDGSGSDDLWSRPESDPWGQRQPNADPFGGGMRPMPEGFGYGQERRTSGYAIASFVLGIIAPIFNGFYLAPSILAITFGIIAIVQCSRHKDLYKGKWMGITGIVLGGVFLLIYIILFAYAFWLLQDPEFASFFQEYMDQIQNAMIFR